MSRKYIWQHPDWPTFSVDRRVAAGLLGEARRDQGAVMALFRAVGLPSEVQVERGFTHASTVIPLPYPAPETLLATV